MKRAVFVFATSRFLLKVTSLLPLYFTAISALYGSTRVSLATTTVLRSLDQVSYLLLHFLDMFPLNLQNVLQRACGLFDDF